ncbi:MAG: VWA domain-containing protein [Kiloniellales bacterium]
MRSGEPLDPGPAQPTILVEAPPDAGSVTVPNGAFLLTADFVRQGDDLLLRAPEGGPDGPDVLLRDYFADGTSPDLVTAGSATISGDLATRLAGPLAPGQYAQAQLGETQYAQATGSSEPVGEVTELTGSALVTRTNGVQQALALGDPVYLGDVLQTGPDTSVGIRFVDNTLFSLSSNARLVIDQVIYNPDGADNALSLSLIQGAFAFVSGGIAPADGPGMSIRTPVATIGVRGTTGAGEFLAAVQRLVVSLLEGLDGDLGAIDVFNSVSLQTLASALDTLTVTSPTEVLPPPSTATQEQLGIYSLALSSLSRSFLDLIQEITPEAGPEQEGGSGSSGGAILADLLQQSELAADFLAPDESGELVGFRVEVDERALADIIAEDPNLILLLQILAELQLTGLTIIVDLDGEEGPEGPVPAGSTNFATVFPEGSDGIPIVGNVAIVSVSGIAQSATITLQPPFDAATESLFLVDGAQLPAGITFDAANSTSSRIVLTGTATTAEYQEALLLIRYLNTAENPGDRVISVELSDGVTMFTAITRIDGASPVLAVGSNADDQAGSAVPHAVPNTEGPGAGPLIGEAIDDVLIGDTGGSTALSVSLVIALDVSNSMNGIDGPGPASRLDLAKAALQNLIGDFNNLSMQGALVTVQIIPFSSNADDPGTFDLSDPDGFDNAIAFLEGIVASGANDYPGAFDAITTHLGSAPPADRSAVYFISDGPSAPSGTHDQTINDFRAFIAAFQGELEVHAVGISVSEDTLELLSQIDSAGDAQLLDGALEADLGGVSARMLLPVGSDVIMGGDGDDVLFGDVINTDHLPSAQFGPAGAHDGVGFDALVAYLADNALAGTAAGEAPTLAQIREFIHSDPFQFIVEGDERGEADTLVGGAGNDILFGQGGGDVLIGGAGDDLLIGGSGQDSFVVSLAQASGNNVILDFEVGAGGDFLRLDDVFDYDGGGVTVADLDSAAAAADGWTIADDGSDVVITLGNNPANNQNGGQITLEGIGDGTINSFTDFAAVANLEVNA